MALAQYTPNNQVANTHVRVEFTITDYFLGETRVGYVDTRIIRAALKFRFAGTRTAVFKPGLPFHGHVRSDSHSGHRGSQLVGRDPDPRGSRPRMPTVQRLSSLWKKK